MLKKMFFSLCVIVFVSNVKANDADFFSFDQNIVKSAVSELSMLEEYVTTNPQLSNAELIQAGNVMVKGISLNTNMFMTGDPALGIPSFLWGCAFGLVGALIVYILTDNDKEEFKKALTGCAVGYIIFGAIYFIALSTASTTSTY